MALRSESLTFLTSCEGGGREVAKVEINSAKRAAVSVVPWAAKDLRLARRARVV